jgi:hypothetical protein
MNKWVVFTAIALLVFLVACKGKQMEAQPLRAPTGIPAEEPLPVVAPEPAAAPVEEGSGKTAAEAIKDLQAQLTTSAPATGGKTLYPPAPAGVTGEEALRARTRALYSQGTGVNQITGGVVTDFPDYTKSSNLPGEYGNSGSAGE